MTPSSTIRLFVSSTFADMKAERDVLQREVFPRLRNKCLELGLRFQAIDLRWGVSAEAGRDNKTMRICLRELRRCQSGGPKPNFLILLGNRYGWCPLPEIIPADIFERLELWLNHGGTENTEQVGRGVSSLTTDCRHRHGSQIESDEDSRTLLRHWYRRDDNAVPPAYVVEPRQPPFDDPEIWSAQVETPLLAALQRAVHSAGLDEEAASLHLGVAATHQEILHGALSLPADEVRQHVHAFARSIRLPPGQIMSPQFSDLREDGSPDPVAKARLDGLRDDLAAHLSSENVHPYTVDWRDEGKFADEDLKQFRDDVIQAMEAVITEQAKMLKRVSAAEQEENAHKEFGKERRAGHVGHTAELTRAADYLAGNEDGPLLVLGPAGSGKTAFIAQVVARARLDYPAALVIERYIGATPAASRIVSVLRDLVQRIRAAYPVTHSADAASGTKPETDIPGDLNPLITVFQEALKRVPPEKPLLLFLDALDQLADDEGKTIAAWLPTSLPSGVRLVVSTVQPPTESAAEKSAATQDYATVAARLSADTHLHLPPLDREHGEQLLAQWLAAVGRTLQPGQCTAVLNAFADEGNPLWLRIATAEASRWPSWEAPSALPTTTPDLIRGMLTRLSGENEHGSVLVERTLGYLACSRHGLSEDEMLDLLSSKEKNAPGGVMAEFRRRFPKSPPVDSLPVATWVPLLGDISPYLGEQEIHGTTLMRFYHRVLLETVQRTFLADGFHHRKLGVASKTKLVTPSIRCELHRALGTYFLKVAQARGGKEWSNSPVRALSELPHHRLKGYPAKRAEPLFCDLHFLEASIVRGLLDQLLGDLEAATRLSMPNVATVRDAVLLSMSAIRQRPAAFLVILVNRLGSGPFGHRLKAHVNRATKMLDMRGPWPCAQTHFGLDRSVNGSVAVSVSRKVFHVLTDNRELETRTLDSQRVIESQAPFQDMTPIEILIHPQSGALVWMDASGNSYYEGDLLPLKLNPRAHGLSFLGSGIVGVDIQGRLTYITLKSREPRILAERLNTVHARSSTNSNCTATVVISSDRLPDQRIFLLRARSAGPQIDEWSLYDSPITAASIDDCGTTLLISSRDRRLMLFNVDGKKLVRETTCRIAGGKPVRGVVISSVLTNYDGRIYALLATIEGELCVWDCTSQGIQNRGYFRGIQQHSALRALAADPARGKFMIVTDTQIQELPILGETELSIAAPVTGCAVSAQGCTVTISTAVKHVTWYDRGQLRDEFVILNYEPSTVALAPAANIAFVGYHKGSVLRLQPNQHPDIEDAVDLFDRAVVSLASLDNDRVLAASANGQFRIVAFRPVRVLRDISPVGNVREEQFIRRLGRGDDFVSCGRYHTGDSLSSVVVIRSNDSREVVTETPDTIVDVAASQDGGAIYVALKEKVQRFVLGTSGWQLIGERIAEVIHLAMCDRDILGAVVEQGGLIWLELWPTATAWEKGLAVAELPFRCRCLAACADFIAVGAIDGRHFVFKIRPGILDEILLAR